MAERRAVEDRYITTLRAFEDHEATAHPIRPPRRWTPANYDGEPWPSGVVSSTFDPPLDGDCPANPPGVHRYDGDRNDPRCIDCGADWEGP
jgi:hypothetical protein